MKDWREDLLYTMDDTYGYFFREYMFKSTEKNDHVHCSICFAKISDFCGKYEKSGYYCKETNDWLCKTCFNDFQKRFDWRLEET